MPRVLIANVDNECMLPERWELTDEFCLASSIAAERVAWFAEPGDIVVLQRQPSRQLTDHIARTMGYAPGAVTYLTPDWNGAHYRPIAANELLNTGLAERVSAMMGDPRDWSLYPYCHERGAQRFAERLGLGDRQVRHFMKQGGAELLNDKRIFRSLAAGRNVAIAHGTVCNTQWELEASVRSLIDITGRVILKQDRNSGGYGNLIISRHDAPDSVGAQEVLIATDDAAIRDQTAIAWSRLAFGEHAVLVVEVYYPTALAVTAEFRVDSARNGVTFLNCGEVRQAPILSGLIMPCALPAYQLASFIANTTELARLCCDLGYDGLLNIDGIITTGGAVIINEINGRIGACSHIHRILQAVGGPSYGSDLVVMSHSKTVAMSVDDVFGVMKRHKLGFDAETRRGIIIVSEDAAETGHLGYISIAPSRALAANIESEFEALLEPAIQEEDETGIGHLARILSHLPPAQQESGERATRDARTLLREGARKP
jgi:Pre ATP-grasp domain/PGM1 C-terminal domain